MVSFRNTPSSVYQSSINRVMVFLIGDDGQLYDKFWNGQEWQWESQGAPTGYNPTVTLVGSPAAVYQLVLGPVGEPVLDRVTAFVVGHDTRLYDKFWNGTAWQWEVSPNGGTPPNSSRTVPSRLLPSPSAVYQPSLERITAFVIGDGPTPSSGNETSFQLYDEFWNGQRWQWETQGAPLSPANVSVAVASPSSVYQTTLDRITCFVIGNGELYDVFWNGSKWQWESQGMPTNSGTGNSVRIISWPSSVYQSSALDRITSFVVGQDGNLYDKFWNGQNWQWEDQGMPTNELGAEVKIVPSPSSVYQPDIDRLTCFVIGEDGNLYDKFWNGQRWQWETLGAPQNASGASVSLTASPSAVYQAELQRLMCFVIGQDGNLYDTFWNGKTWEWEGQGTP
jgi:hypothetical protein